MGKRTATAAGLLVIILGVLAYMKLVPDERKAITARLEKLRGLVTVEQTLAPLEAASRASAIAAMFAEQATVEVKLPAGAGGQHRLSGRKEIRDTLLLLGARARPFNVSFVDVKVELEPGHRNAVAWATAQAKSPAENWAETIELKFSFEKRGAGDWLIARAETHDSLQR